MNTGQLFKVENQLLSREQVVALARRAAVTAEELANPKPTVIKDTPLERHIDRIDGRVVRLLKMQDSKYGVLLELEPISSRDGSLKGSIANLNTGMEIPESEPLMIFRAQDRFSLLAIETYTRAVTGEGNAIDVSTADSAQERFMAFQMFAESYPERMKTPD